MGRKLRDHGPKGQTALILILLTAGALIFLAVTYNWGRMAQTKALISTAAYQTASFLASLPASYGEMEKQTYLKDRNKKVVDLGFSFFTLLLAVATFVIGLATGQIELFTFAFFISALSIVMAVVNLVLFSLVLVPSIVAMWNDLQKNQPQFEQFFEQGIMTSLQGSVTDQVKIADYLDSNADGRMGLDPQGLPNDTVSRFDLYYTDRLKMINNANPINPLIKCFDNELQNLMSGEDCYRNATDATLNCGVSADPRCGTDCINNPTASQCTSKVGPFQLSDGCATATSSPYCNPCCQPQTQVNNYGNQTMPTRSTACGTGIPSACYTNNPYNSAAGADDSPYPYLYDPSFQNYKADISFMAQYGRDQQQGPSTPSTINPQVIGPASDNVDFPNGIYPFFWLMNEYSPEIDNINPILMTVQPNQDHWCAPSTNIPAVQEPVAYTDLQQLSLPYTCSGANCCTGILSNSFVGGVPTLTGPAIIMDSFGNFGSTPNPAEDKSFGLTGFPWQPADNQVCTANWVYNGSSNPYPSDGSCAWSNTPPSGCDPTVSSCADTTFQLGVTTLDQLDETMHTLSGFIAFANSLLKEDVGRLNATFQNWYSSMAAWTKVSDTNLPCANGGSCDPNTGMCPDNTVCSMGQGSLPTVTANLDTWYKLINDQTGWLAQATYMSPTDWCLPAPGDPSMLVNGAPTLESSFISSQGRWGTLPSLIACLNYNAGGIATATPAGTSNFTQAPLPAGVNGAAANYQQCLNALPASACPAALPPECDPAILGRSLAGPNPNNFNGTCDPTVAGSFAKWVSDSYNLFNDEQSKFVLRAGYLTDIYNRAVTMENIFAQGRDAINNFIDGPAAALDNSFFNSSSSTNTTTVPNSVIYGWQDAAPTGGSGGCTDPANRSRVGCVHLVEVSINSVGKGANPRLPWIKSTVKRGFLGIPTEIDYTLVDRDGLVQVGIKRWDEDHAPMFFPNGRPLWQEIFSNTGTFQNIMDVCRGVPLPNCTSGNCLLGFGLLPSTAGGLAFQNISQNDSQALANAFMLNGSAIDPSAPGSGYSTCLSMAKTLLSQGMKSYACGAYVASLNASAYSGDFDEDYSVRFLGPNQGCGPPDDSNLT